MPLEDKLLENPRVVAAIAKATAYFDSNTKAGRTHVVLGIFGGALIYAGWARFIYSKNKVRTARGGSVVFGRRCPRTTLYWGEGGCHAW